MNNCPIMLWTVLQEVNDGYLIVYSEDFEEYGLAIKNKANEKIFIGIYGDFREMVYAM